MVVRFTHRLEIKHLADDRLRPFSRTPIPGRRDVTARREVDDTLIQCRSTAKVVTAQCEGLGALSKRDGRRHVGRVLQHSLVRGGLWRHAVEGDYPGNAWLDHEEARKGFAVIRANRV